MLANSSIKQQYETLMSNIAQAKGLHNLPKKELNQLGLDLGLGSLKKHEMIHSISSKLIQMILTQNSMEIPNHPVIQNSPILKDIIKGFFEQLNPGKQNAYNTQSQQSQQQQQQLYLQQLMELYGQGSSQNQNQLYQYQQLQASQQANQPSLSESAQQAGQVQLQQLLYSQYPQNAQQIQQIQQLLAQQLQQPQSQQVQSSASALSALQIQQAAAAGSVLGSSSLTPQQQQQLIYQQYLSDPTFASLSQQQQQYILQQIQQQQQQQQQYQQLSSAQHLASQTSQQQLLQQHAALQQQQLQQQMQQQQYNQLLYLQQQATTQNPSTSGNKQKLSKTQCICFSCDRLIRDLNKLREEERSNKAIECISCHNKFHATCVKVSVNSEQSRIYECPICTLEKLDPLNKTIEVVQPPTIIYGSGSITYFQVPNELYIKLGKKHHSVEIRCIRIDGTKNMYETTWPDSGECSLNQHKLKEYVPLQQNSSLKKRKDEKYNIKDVSLIKKDLNLIQIKENVHQHSKTSYRIDPNSIHVFAIYLVKKVPHSEFISSIPSRLEDDCKDIIKRQFVQADERKKQKILLEQQKQQQSKIEKENEQVKKSQSSDQQTDSQVSQNGQQVAEPIEIESEGNQKNQTITGTSEDSCKVQKQEQQEGNKQLDEQTKKSENNQHATEIVEEITSKIVEDVTTKAEEIQNKIKNSKTEDELKVQDPKEDKVNGEDITSEQTKEKQEEGNNQKSSQPEKMETEEQQIQQKEEKIETENENENIKQEKIEVKEEQKVINEGSKKPNVIEVEIQDNEDKDNILQDEDDEEDTCISIDKLNVSLNCTFDFNMIKTPAKGKHCKHVQCFSLENMLLFTEATVPRKWRCPICKLKCYDIVIDSYMQKIIQSFKEQNLAVAEISFDKDANYEIHKLKKEDEDDDEDDIQPKQLTNAANLAPEANKEVKTSLDKQEKPQEGKLEDKQAQQIIGDQNKQEGVAENGTLPEQTEDQGKDEKKKKKSINEDPVIILDEDEEDAEEKKKQLQQKLLLSAIGGNTSVNDKSSALTNGKGNNENGVEGTQEAKDNQDKDAMNIEEAGKEAEDKLNNEINKGGEISKEKVEIPESFFKLKEKLTTSIANSQNVYSDDYTFEEFQETQADKIQEFKLKSVRQSCRNKITKNLKKQYPELVNLIKKDAPQQAITSLEQYEQTTNRRNNLFGGIGDYSKVLGSTGVTKEPSSKNKNYNKSSTTGLHTGATSATLQLPSSFYGYDMLGAQSLIPPFTSNSYNLFGQRNPSTYNFIPLTTQQANSASVPGLTSAGAATNPSLSQFVNPLSSITGAGVLSSNPAVNLTAAAGTQSAAASSTNLAAATQYYQQLLEQNDLSSMLNQFQFGFGGQSNLNNLLNLAQLTQPNQYSSTAGIDPSLYNNYLNLGMNSSLLGGQNNLVQPNIPSTSGQASTNVPKKSSKQKGSSTSNKKNSQPVGQASAINGSNNGSKGAVTTEVYKGKADDPICLED